MQIVNPKTLQKQNARAINKIVLHCSATREGVPITAGQIKQWHKRKGWSDIGYHYVIELDGKTKKGRADETVGAHVSGHNHDSIGICYIGGLDSQGGAKDTRTKEQRRAMTALVDRLTKLYPSAEVEGHRDLSPDLDGDGVVGPHEWLKQCPCFPAKLWWGGKY